MNYPLRPQNHVLENISKLALRQAMPQEWILNEYFIDYGTDFQCEIVKNNAVLGIKFSIQLKAKKIENDLESVKIKNIKRSTINRWVKSLEPIMIVAYVNEEKAIYWQWVTENTFDLTKNQKSYQIKISKKQILNEDSWDEITKHVEKIFERKYLLYHLPEEKGIHDEAWQLFSNGKFENSLVQFKLSYDEQSPDALTLQAIAICEYQIFKYREALITINKALELQDEPLILQTKASILTEIAKQDKDEKLMIIAKSLYEKILMGYRDPAILCNYGNCLYNLKNIDDAIRVYEESLVLNPNNAEAWNSLGNAYNEVGLFQNAIKCFDNAQLVNPELIQAVFNKGQTIFAKFGDPILGLEFMLHAIEMDKSNTFELEFPYVYFWVSEAFLKVGDNQRALIMNSKGMDIYPSDNCFNQQRDRIQQVIKLCT